MFKHNNMNEICYQISTEIWEDTINLIFTDDIEQSIINQAALQQFDPSPYLFGGKQLYGAVLIIEEPNYRANWMLFNYDAKEHTVVHEIEHFVFHLLNSKGLKHNKKTTEAYAYTFAYIYKKVMGIYRELNINV